MKAVSRRNFLQRISALSTGAALGFGGLRRSLHAGANLPIGIQLYTVRDLSRGDFKGTLRKVAEIGYKHFEYAGYGNFSAAEIKAFTKELGVTACGTHEGIQNFEKDSGNVVSFNKTLGTPYVVVPSMPRNIRSGGASEIEKFATTLNKYGKLVKNAGMQLCYHNHSFEFEKVEDGRTIWDVLLNATNADLVKAEVDIAWVYNADVDPVGLLDQWGDRVKLLHMKDLDKNRKLAPVGEGEIELEKVVAKAKQIGVDWYIVEQDRTREGKDILDEITISYKNMVQLLS
jgi:sugar phosphate isomerase/epimerase